MHQPCFVYDSVGHAHVEGRHEPPGRCVAVRETDESRETVQAEAHGAGA
jgi:hypothetical protein